MLDVPSSNPLLSDWRTPFETPPFASIKPEHFEAAFARAFAEHMAEIGAITVDPAPPDFDNTIVALERSGKLLTRVSGVFYGLVSAHSNPALLDFDKALSPRMARHWNDIMMNAPLYARIDALWRMRDSLGLNEEQARLLERTRTRFHRSGAGLDAAAKVKLAAISERLAELGTAFSHHLLADEQDWTLALSEGDLAGLPDAFVANLRAAAAERAQDGQQSGQPAAGPLMTVSRSYIEPFLQRSVRRDLREKVWRAFVARGDNANENDNNAVIAETVRLRDDYARILGYPGFAAYKLEDSMAKTPEAVRGLLDRVWVKARARALADRDAMQELIAEEGGNFKLAAWDWRYYAEKLRQRRADFDDGAIKPYLALDNMLAAAFDTAQKLFGISFTERKDIPVWHADVRVWEVKRPDGSHVGLFYGDYFARSSKRSGAWMTSFRDQQKLDGAIAPLIVNVCNFTKGAAGDPALLSPDDARTLFHEMGHALHGMLSNVTYPSLSGTSVFTDFVELPSQLYEHWQERPEVLKRFARHYQTGEPLPDDLLKRFLAARKFNQGFATVEYVSCALIDLEFHSQAPAASADVHAFERKELARIGMPEEIALRHRPQQFSHIFSGDHYASGYYSYMWSEVMDADAFGAFEEAGDVFDKTVARRLHDNVLSVGGARDPEQAYKAFRGREPEPEALLRRRGLVEA